MMALNGQLGAHTRLLAFLDAPLFMHLKCLLPSTASPPPPPARRHHLLLASCCVRRQHRNGALRVIGTGRDWTCETPALLEAVASLVALRRDWEETAR